MKLSLKILKWIFLAYGIFLPLVLFLVPSQARSQGVPYLITPLIVLYFLILFLWVFFLLKYSSKNEGLIETPTKVLINIQIIWLYSTIVVPLTARLGMDFIMQWYEIPNILDIIVSYYMFMLYSTPVSVVGGIVAVIYYGRKTN